MQPKKRFSMIDGFPRFHARSADVTTGSAGDSCARRGAGSEIAPIFTITSSRVAARRPSRLITKNNSRSRLNEMQPTRLRERFIALLRRHQQLRREKFLRFPHEGLLVRKEKKYRNVRENLHEFRQVVEGRVDCAILRQLRQVPYAVVALFRRDGREQLLCVRKIGKLRTGMSRDMTRKRQEMMSDRDCNVYGERAEREKRREWAANTPPRGLSAVGGRGRTRCDDASTLTRSDFTKKRRMTSVGCWFVK